jgi:hypothetical protein
MLAKQNKRVAWRHSALDAESDNDDVPIAFEPDTRSIGAPSLLFGTGHSSQLLDCDCPRYRCSGALLTSEDGIYDAALATEGHFKLRCLI